MDEKGGLTLYNNLRLHLEYWEGRLTKPYIFWQNVSLIRRYRINLYQCSSIKVQHQSTASDLQVILFGSEEMIS